MRGQIAKEAPPPVLPARIELRLEDVVPSDVSMLDLPPEVWLPLENRGGVSFGQGRVYSDEQQAAFVAGQVRGQLPEEERRLCQQVEAAAYAVLGERAGERFRLFSEAASRLDYLTMAGMDTMTGYVWSMLYFTYKQLELEPFTGAKEAVQALVTARLTGNEIAPLALWQEFGRRVDLLLDRLPTFAERLVPILESVKDSHKPPLDRTAVVVEINQVVSALAQLEFGALGLMLEGPRDLAAQDLNIATFLMVEKTAELISRVPSDPSQNDTNEWARLYQVMSASEQFPERASPDDWDAFCRAGYSRALVLLRDAIGRFSTPWVFAIGNKVLGEMTGVKNYGYRFSLLSWRQYLRDVAPDLFAWYGGKIKALARAGFNPELLESRVSTEVNFKGVWGVADAAVFEDRDLRDHIARVVEQARHQVMFSYQGEEQLVEPFQLESRFTWYTQGFYWLGCLHRLLMIRDQLDGRIGESLVKEITELEAHFITAMGRVKDIGRMRLTIGGGDWDEVLVIPSLAPLAQVVFAATDKDRVPRPGMVLPLTVAFEIAAGRIPVGYEEQARVIRGWVEAANAKGATHYGKLTVGTLMAVWMVACPHEYPFSAVFVSGSVDCGFGGTTLPVEIQLQPRWYAGQDVARRNWESRLHYQIYRPDD